MDSGDDKKAPYRAVIVSSSAERDAAMAVRMIVFVEEQAVPVEEELDAYDVAATHFLVRRTDLIADDPNAVIGAARLVDKGGGVAKIGRVAVLAEHRGRGVGTLLMQLVEEVAIAGGFHETVLEAQCQAIPFYEKLGYRAEGDIFLDAGIEHRLMRKHVSP